MRLDINYIYIWIVLEVLYTNKYAINYFHCVFLYRSDIEDYAYTAGYGDLDYYNGRYCVTPEYPSGTYAYFIAVNSSYVPQYPYIIGPSYYGTPITTQTGTISETVTTYYSYSSGK